MMTDEKILKLAEEGKLDEVKDSLTDKLTAEDLEEMKDMIAINPETGEFDLSRLSAMEQAEVRKMANSMIMKKKHPSSKSLRKKKPKVKKPKTFGKNKKKKKK